VKGHAPQLAAVYVLQFFFPNWLVSELMPPSAASGTTWSESGWQAKQWKGRSSGTWEQDPWAQWTGWQGKSTGSWWDTDTWKADPEGHDDGDVSDDERASDEQKESCPWLHCVAKEDSAEDDSHPAEPKTECPPDADELAALHAAALKQFLLGDGDDLPGSDTEVSPSAAPADAAELPEVIPIHGADAKCAFYNPTTGGVDCQLCGMHLNSLKQWEDHRTGKKHVKKLSNPKLACEAPPVPVAST